MGIELYETYQAYEGSWSESLPSTASLEDFISLENEFYTSQERIIDESYIPLEEIEAMIRSPFKKRRTKIYLLHIDERVKKDITPYVLKTGNLDKNNSSGQCRSISLTFANPAERISLNKKRSRFLPFEIWDDFESNAKIKIITEIFYNNKIYQIQEGIFVAFDPKMSSQAGNDSLVVQFYDKFALLDGTIDGKGELDHEIPAGTFIYDAVTQLLRLPKNSRGEPFDEKEVFFPKEYRNERLAYTIKKTSENSIGDLLKDVAKSISCDLQYNNYGNLVFSHSNIELDYHNRSVSWNYQNNSQELVSPNVDIKRSQIKNKVIVIGANINGYLCKGIAENKNPNSLYNINSSFGVKTMKITDNLIPSNSMCAERANYELKKSMTNYITFSFQSTWIPHLEPNDIIRWTKDEWGIESEEFLVKSISLPLDSSQLMSVTATNLKEISL